MITIKTQLIQDIFYSCEKLSLKTIEVFADGTENETTHVAASKERLIEIIENDFDDELNGQFEGFPPTKIVGWSFEEIDFSGDLAVMYGLKNGGDSM